MGKMGLMGSIGMIPVKVRGALAMDALFSWANTAHAIYQIGRAHV
jgi:hypothetical protein